MATRRSPNLHACSPACGSGARRGATVSAVRSLSVEAGERVLLPLAFILPASRREGIVINLAPVLFIPLRAEFGLTYEQIGRLQMELGWLKKKAGVDHLPG